MALFDRTRIRDTLTVHKQRMGWHNLVIRPETVDRLLENDGWCVLHAPPERLQAKRIEDVRAREVVAASKETPCFPMLVWFLAESIQRPSARRVTTKCSVRPARHSPTLYRRRATGPRAAASRLM